MRMIRVRRFGLTIYFLAYTAIIITHHLSSERNPTHDARATVTQTDQHKQHHDPRTCQICVTDGKLQSVLLSTEQIVELFCVSYTLPPAALFLEQSESAPYSVRAPPTFI